MASRISATALLFAVCGWTFFSTAQHPRPVGPDLSAGIRSFAWAAQSSPTAETARVHGPVLGGVTGLAGATANLYVVGLNTPIATVTTDDTGHFTAPLIPHTIPGYSGALYYVVVTGGGPKGSSNPNTALLDFIGTIPPGLPSSVSITVNELTTVTAAQVALAYGMTVNPGTGIISSPPPGASFIAAVAAMDMIVNHVTGAPNPSLPATQSSVLNTLGDALASCIQMPSSCSALYNALTVNGSPATSSNTLAAAVALAELADDQSVTSRINALVQNLAAGEKPFSVIGQPPLALALQVAPPPGVVWPTQMELAIVVHFPAISGIVAVGNVNVGTPPTPEFAVEQVDPMTGTWSPGPSLPLYEIYTPAPAAADPTALLFFVAEAATPEIHWPKVTMGTFVGQGGCLSGPGVLESIRYIPTAGAGMLAPIDTAPLGTCPNTPVTDPSGSHIYVSDRTANDVEAFSVVTSGPITGALTPLGTNVTDTSPSTVTLDTKGNFAFVGSKNGVDVFGIDGQGALHPLPQARIPGGHSYVKAVPKSELIVVSDTTARAVTVYGLNPQFPQKSPMPWVNVATLNSPSSGPSSWNVAAPPSPAVFNASGTMMYVNTGIAYSGAPSSSPCNSGQSGAIYAFSISSVGLLSLLPTQAIQADNLGGVPTGVCSPPPVITPNGQYVYVVNPNVQLVPVKGSLPPGYVPPPNIPGYGRVGQPTGGPATISVFQISPSNGSHGTFAADITPTMPKGQAIIPTVPTGPCPDQVVSGCNASSSVMQAWKGIMVPYLSVMDPKGGFLYLFATTVGSACPPPQGGMIALGSEFYCDAVYTYAINPADGSLTPAGPPTPLGEMDLGAQFVGGPAGQQIQGETY